MWNKYTKNKCKYYTSSRYQKLGQISIKKRNDALTPVISAVLAALIVTSIVGSVLSWGVPYVENLRSKSLQENIGMQFKTVADDLDDLVHAYPGERKISNLAIEEGYLSVDGVRDRTVVLYSYDEEYEFVITSIEDGTVTVKMIQSPVGFEGFNESWIYWFDYGEYCFLAGTKILMADSSYKNIENVKIGEQVLSYDKHTGGVVSSKVVNVFHHSPEEMTEYYLVINEVLKVTPNHRFYSDGRWVYAGDLKIGDPLHPKEQNQDYIVYSIDRVYERDASFDLEVERCHNYFVSIDDNNVDILVHNDDDRIGTIWIFDSNSLTYKKSFSMGTQETIMENGGIIHSEAGDSYVQKEPSVYASGDTFSIHALQTVAAAFSGSGTGDLKFRMYSNLYNSNIRETGQVYYLRLQFWGDHSDTWLSYYNNTYQFNDDPDPDASNSLLYTPSTNEGGVWFALANSIIRFSIR